MPTCVETRVPSMCNFTGQHGRRHYHYTQGKQQVNTGHRSLKTLDQQMSMIRLPTPQQAAETGSTVSQILTFANEAEHTAQQECISSFENARHVQLHVTACVCTSSFQVVSNLPIMQTLQSVCLYCRSYVNDCMHTDQCLLNDLVSKYRLQH